MSDFVAQLDNALVSYGEDIILRRILPDASTVDVTCRARVDAASAEQVAAGILATDLNIIISPTQISAAGWPGVASSGEAPFIVDQSIPRAGVTDKVLLRGLAPKAVAFVDTKIIGGVVVRHNLRVSG